MKTFKMILFFILTVILTAFTPFSGVLMPLFLMLSAAFLITMSVRWHVLYAVFSAAFSGLLIYFLSPFATGLAGIVASFGLPFISLVSSVMVYVALKKRADMKVLLLSGTTGLFLLVAAICLKYGGSFVADFINMAKVIMLETLDSVMLSIPTESAASIEEIKVFYNYYFETLKIVAPAVILSLIFLVSYFSIKIASKLWGNKPDYSAVTPFSEIRSSAFLTIVTIVSYFGQNLVNPFISGLMANLFILLTVYLTLCGYSFLDFLVKPRAKNIYLRLIIYIAITLILTVVSSFMYFANPILIAMVIGVADSLFNYRARIRLIRGK